MRDNIRAERARLRITQKEMAKKIGLSETNYNIKEKGRKDFTETEMIKIAQILNVSLDYLFMPIK